MASQGGKGKSSSQSDKNYWARLKAAGGVSPAKKRKIAEAAKRKQGVIAYGRPPTEFSPQRVVFSGTPKEDFPKAALVGYFPHFVVVAGVTVDVLSRETDAITSLGTAKRRLPGYVARVTPSGSTIVAR
jgi:hypothetical protein